MSEENKIAKINEDYFIWLYSKVCAGKVNDILSFEKTLRVLHSIEYIPSYPRDENRANDGIELRYYYSYETNNIDAEYYITGPCSVLEMMVALAIKIEDTMINDFYGDRTKQWFWGMMRNLQIGTMDNDLFDEEYIRMRIDIFQNLSYDREGRGGLFFVANPHEDMRDVEIWTQMCWYIDYYN